MGPFATEKANSRAQAASNADLRTREHLTEVEVEQLRTQLR